MVACEMCGVDTSSLKDAVVAGSNVKVCNSCSSMGTMKNEDRKQTHSFTRRKREDENLEVSSDYVKIIREGISKKGLTPHQVARAVNIKESSLSNYLKGQIKPIIENARKLENFLGIKLVESVDGGNVSVDDFKVDSDDSSGLSLGDMILNQMKK